ncbi:MAG: hypothetical protein MI785_09365 [Kiloniellales bacterium]|nr:hypothetical protein [Kiloniellales bacterium]
MTATAFISAVLLLLGLATAPSVSSAAEPIYINTYGSDWGLWARGHCLLSARAEVETLEIEAVTLQPNRNYPQALEIAGFGLSAAYVNAATGEPLGRQAASGPRIDYAVSLAPDGKHVVEDLILQVPRGRLPGAKAARVLVLHIFMSSGSAFEIEVARRMES